MDMRGAYGPEAVQVALQSWLDAHPEAPIAAINEYGLFVPVPESLDVTGREVLDGLSALDLVVPADRVVVIQMWERAREAGAARTSIRLAAKPEQQVGMHVFDVRPIHGVFVGVLVPEGDADPVVDVKDAPPVTPRLSRMRKTELAVFTEVDDAITGILGWRVDEIVGRGSLDLIHPEDQDRAIRHWMEMLAAPGTTRRVRLRHRHADGHWVWLELTNHNLLDDPEFGCIVAEAVDISDEVAAQEAVRAREQLLHRIAETVPLGLLQVDESGRVVYTNERLHEIVGRGPATLVNVQLAGVVPDDWPRLAAALEDVLGEGGDRDIEVEVSHAGHSEFRQCRLSLRALRNDEGAVTGAIVCVDDITEGAMLRAELERRATLDALTACSNRASVMSILDGWLADESTVGAVFVDLDDFKQVNDDHGHAAGDELLVIVAERLRGAVRTSDTVGRLGGDEFLVVCPGVRGAEEVMTIAERMADSLSRPVCLSAGEFEVRASIGVAISSGSGCDGDRLVAEADRAMYESKRMAAGRPVILGPGNAPATPATPRVVADRAS